MYYSHKLNFGRSEIKILSVVRHACQDYGFWCEGSVDGNVGHDIVTIKPPQKWHYSTF
jgi:hypothetical protein